MEREAEELSGNHGGHVRGYDQGTPQKTEGRIDFLVIGVAGDRGRLLRVFLKSLAKTAKKD